MSAPVAPGRNMAREMRDQPEVFERILADGLPQIRRVAAAIGERSPRFALFSARGTSDNAALYAKYLVEVLLGMPAGLASPSTTTVYDARPDLRDVLAIAVSQSGGSPDLVDSTALARERGALTVAVTNAATSPLADTAELHLDMLAGPEEALPATKTYTAELLSLFLLVDALRGGDGSAARALPEQAADLLGRGDEVAGLAQRYRFADRLVTTSRGYSYPTALEAALKIMETSYLSAHAFSGADLLHGPLAIVDQEIPVIAVVPDGLGGHALAPVLTRLRERAADLCVVGTADEVSRSTIGFVLPDGVAEEVSPILSILPLQRLAFEIAMGRGLDPDAPRALAKITETR